MGTIRDNHPQKKRVNRRADHTGTSRVQYEHNRKHILASQTICGICGKPVDKSLTWPHPLSACIDHIIPIDKGGHPFSLDNLQLAHMTCNRAKSDKLFNINSEEKNNVLSNRVLPHSADWAAYKG